MIKSQENLDRFIYLSSLILIFLLIIRIFIGFIDYTFVGIAFSVLYMWALIGTYGKIKFSILGVILIATVDITRFFTSDYFIFMLILNLFLIGFAGILLFNDLGRV